MIKFKNITISIVVIAVFGIAINAFAHGGKRWGQQGPGWSQRGGYGQGFSGQMSDEEFKQFDRQRRTVTNAFIQAQTMQNKELLEHGSAEGHERRFARMRATRDDPDQRYDFLMRQSMINSLRDAEKIH